jgi:hypothetical protein
MRHAVARVYTRYLLLVRRRTWLRRRAVACFERVGVDLYQATLRFPDPIPRKFGKC